MDLKRKYQGVEAKIPFFEHAVVGEMVACAYAAEILVRQSFYLQ